MPRLTTCLATCASEKSLFVSRPGRLYNGGATIGSCSHIVPQMAPATLYLPPMEREVAMDRSSPLSRVHPTNRLLGNAPPSMRCAPRSATSPPTTPSALPLSLHCYCRGKWVRARDWSLGSSTRAVLVPRARSSTLIAPPSRRHS